MEARGKRDSELVQNVMDAASLQVGSLIPIMMLYWRVAAEAFTTAAQAAAVVVATRAAEGIAEIAQASQEKSGRGRSAPKKSRKRRSNKV
jgi:hypothetical protein